MPRSLATCACLFSLLSLLGCSGKQPAARKEIQVPDGGPPVLTSAERTRLEMQKPRVPGVVAQAAYEQSSEPPQPAIKPFEQWTDQDAAEDALGRIGAPAVPALLDALRSTNPGVRRKAVEVLGRMGEEAAPAVPALTALLDDSDMTVRKAAARTLGQIGPAAKDAVPALMRTLFQQPPPSPVHHRPCKPSQRRPLLLQMPSRLVPIIRTVIQAHLERLSATYLRTSNIIPP
jgi:hypothetical protein